MGRQSPLLNAVRAACGRRRSARVVRQRHQRAPWKCVLSSTARKDSVAEPPIELAEPIPSQISSSSGKAWLNLAALGQYLFVALRSFCQVWGKHGWPRPSSARVWPIPVELDPNLADSGPTWLAWAESAPKLHTLGPNSADLEQFRPSLGQTRPGVKPDLVEIGATLTEFEPSMPCGDAQ